MGRYKGEENHGEDRDTILMKFIEKTWPKLQKQPAKATDSISCSQASK